MYVHGARNTKPGPQTMLGPSSRLVNALTISFEARRRRPLENKSLEAKNRIENVYSTLLMPVARRDATFYHRARHIGRVEGRTTPRPTAEKKR